MTTLRRTTFVGLLIPFLTFYLFLQGSNALAEARTGCDSSNKVTQGLLKPYKPASFDQLLPLSPVDEETLEAGKSVLKKLDDGRTVMVQDVVAPKNAVLRQVVDVPHYVGKVPKLKQSDLYFCRKNPDGTSTIRIKGVVNIFLGYTYTYYIDHTYYPEEGSMAWSLDYDKSSDFEDMTGIWKIQDHPKDPKKRSRVFYACDLKLKLPVPKVVADMLIQTNRNQALEWSKRESEANPSLVLPDDFDPEQFFNNVHMEKLDDEL